MRGQRTDASFGPVCFCGFFSIDVLGHFGRLGSPLLGDVNVNGRGRCWGQQDKNSGGV